RVDGISRVGDKAAAGDEIAFEVDRGQFVPGCQLDDYIVMNVRQPLPDTIRAPFGSRANAVTARSIPTDGPSLMRRACFRSRTAGQGALTTTDSSDVQECRALFPADIPRSSAPAASDRLAPSQQATSPGARQQSRPDAENFGGEVSFFNLPLASHHSI